MSPIESPTAPGPASASQAPGASTDKKSGRSKERKGAVILPPVKPEAGKPLYTTVKEAIRRAIDDGTYTAGQRIPSTQQISRQLNVSLVTAHRALQELVAGGVLQRTQGRGTFVSKIEGNGTGVRARSRVGIVLHRDSSIADYYHGRIFEGIRQASHDEHVDLVLLRFGEDLRRECDGLLCVNPLTEEVDSVASRASVETPVVVVGATVEIAKDQRGLCCIDSDNFDIARQAVGHLIDLGHKRLGFLGGNDSISNSRDRWRGFIATCDSNTLTPSPGHVMRPAGWQLTEDERKQLVAMLRAPDRPTAMFAAGYHFGLDLYAAANEAEVVVGKDLALIAVDDPTSAAHLSPALATVRQPLQQMGAIALKALQRLINGNAVQSELLVPELILRESACPPV